MRIEQVFEESKSEENAKEVDDIKSALDDITSTKVYDDGKNFNVSFKAGGTEYYIRPNDKGSEEFYIDSDDDDFDEVKIKDISELKKKVKSMKD